MERRERSGSVGLRHWEWWLAGWWLRVPAGRVQVCQMYVDQVVGMSGIRQAAALEGQS